MAYGNENHLLITWLMMVDHWWQWIIMGYLTGDLTGYREFYWVLKGQLTRNYRTSSCLKCKNHQKRVFYMLWRVKWGWCLGSEVIFLHPAYSWVDIPMFSGGPYSWYMCAHQILDLCLATQCIRPHHFWVRSTFGWTLHANFSWETFFSSLPPILVYIYIYNQFLWKILNVGLFNKHSNQSIDLSILAVLFANLTSKVASYSAGRVAEAESADGIGTQLGAAGEMKQFLIVIKVPSGKLT